MNKPVARQLGLALILAMFSFSLVFGAIVLSFTESGQLVARLPSPPPTTQPPQVTLVLLTPATPGLPGQFTPTATPEFIQPPTNQAGGLPSAVSCTAPAGWFPLTIQFGDTLDSIAQRYGISVDTLSQANCLVNVQLPVGATLYVPSQPTATSGVQCGPPFRWIYYTVQPSDNLFRLSLAFNVSVAELQFANCMGGSTLIRAGQRLYVPNVPTLTWTPTVTPQATITPSPTATPSLTATLSPTPTSGVTILPPSITPTPSDTPTDTPTATATESATGTETSTSTSTPTETPTSSATPTATPTPPTATASPGL